MEHSNTTLWTIPKLEFGNFLWGFFTNFIFGEIPKIIFMFSNSSDPDQRAPWFENMDSLQRDVGTNALIGKYSRHR